MTDQELDLNELNEALKNLDQGEDDDPPKKDNKGEPEQNEGQTEQQHSNTEKDDKRKVDIDTVYQLLNKMKNEDSSNGTKKQQKQKKPKTEKQQKQFEELQRKREQKREQERKEKEKQKLLQEVDIDSLVNQKLQGILQQYEQQYEQPPAATEQQYTNGGSTMHNYQPSTTAPQAKPVDEERKVYPYHHLTTDPPKQKEPPSIFKNLGLKTNQQKKTVNQSTNNKIPQEQEKPVNVFDFFKKA